MFVVLGAVQHICLLSPSGQQPKTGWQLWPLSVFRQSPLFIIRVASTSSVAECCFAVYEGYICPFPFLINFSIVFYFFHFLVNSLLDTSALFSSTSPSYPRFLSL